MKVSGRRIDSVGVRVQGVGFGIGLVIKRREGFFGRHFALRVVEKISRQKLKLCCCREMIVDSRLRTRKKNSRDPASIKFPT